MSIFKYSARILPFWLCFSAYVGAEPILYSNNYIRLTVQCDLDSRFSKYFSFEDFFNSQTGLSSRKYQEKRNLAVRIYIDGTDMNVSMTIRPPWPKGFNIRNKATIYGAPHDAPWIWMAWVNADATEIDGEIFFNIFRNMPFESLGILTRGVHLKHYDLVLENNNGDQLKFRTRVMSGRGSRKRSFVPPLELSLAKGAKFRVYPRRGSFGSLSRWIFPFDDPVNPVTGTTNQGVVRLFRFLDTGRK